MVKKLILKYKKEFIHWLNVWVYDKYLILYTKNIVVSVYQIPQKLLPVSKFITKENSGK